MDAKNLLLEAMSRDECQRAGRALAAYVRAEVSKNVRDARSSSRLDLRDLRAIAAKYKVREIEFDAPIVGDGELAHTDGGLKIRVSGGMASRRARFTIAHEIAHAVLRELGYSEWETVARRQGRACEAEEMICEAFGGELLFPVDVATSALRDRANVVDAREMALLAEREGRQWGVSVQTALGGFNRSGLWPQAVLVVVLRMARHVRTECDPLLRVVDRYPKPSMGWFIPANRRAVTVGLQGALQLHQHWQDFPDREPGRRYRRSAVLGLHEADGTRIVLVNDTVALEDVSERLLVHRKEAAKRPWQQLAVRAPVVYRYYASAAWNAYCVAFIQLDPRSIEVERIDSQSATRRSPWARRRR